jgi:transposase
VYFSRPPWDETSPQWRALDTQIEEGDLVRVISQSVDDGIFDVEAVWDVYSGRGSAAHPPDLLLKLAIYEHCRGRTKPIQWHRDLKSDIKVQWLTFGMKVPQRTVYRFRDRVGSLLESWNQQVLEFAVAEGLVEGRQASIDGTTVAANASRRKLGNKQQVEQRLEQLEQAMSSSLETSSRDTTSQDSAEPSLEPGWMAKTGIGKLEQHARYRKAQARLSELLAENEKRRSDKRKPEEKIVISLTDPESVFGLDKEKVYRPLYNVQTVSDLPTDFVLAYEVFAQHSDSGTLQTLMNKIHDSGIQVEDLLADAGYPVGEDLEFCERSGITLYAPWQENSSTAKRKKQSSEPRLEKDEFQWDDACEVYVCPEGKELPYSHQKTRQRARGETIRFDVYQASPSDCTACPLQARCTTAPQTGRTVRRDPYQEEIDRLKTRMQTETAKSLYKYRSQTIERVFADFKEHRNLRRFRGRGLSRARTQLGLTVLGHNLRLLAKLREKKKHEPDDAITPKTAA